MAPVSGILLFLAFAAFAADVDTLPGPCDSLKDLYSQARCLDAHGKSSEALFVMDSVVKSDSSFQKSRFYLHLLLKCNDKVVLKKYAPVFAARFLDSGEVAVECAQAYSMGRNWKKGVELLEKAYAERRRFEYLTGLAAIYMENKAYEPAQSILEKITSVDSTYAEAYYIRGTLVFKRTLFQRIKERKTKEELAREALGHFYLAARFDSLNYLYVSVIGDMYDSLGVWDSTAFYYRKAVDLAPGNFALLLKFGKKLYDRRSFTECLAVFEKAFLVDSMNVDLVLQIEETHKRIGDYAAYYLTGQERLANSMPDTLSIRYNLALEYVKRDSLNKAEVAFKKVLAKNDAFAEANRGLAGVYLKEGKFQDALPYLNKQAGMAGSSDRDLYNLAQTSLLTGDTATGVLLYEKVLSMNPKSAASAFFLGTYYYNDKDYENCLRVLKDGLDYAEPAAAARMAGGSLFYLKREPVRAAELLKKCEGTVEDDETLHYMLASVFEQLRDPGKALTEYEKCLKAAPDGKNSDYYRDKIRALNR